MSIPEELPGDPIRQPPENPTLGRRAGYHLDENGEVTGIWFTVDCDYFVEFTDVAIPCPPKPGAPETPAG